MAIEFANKMEENLVNRIMNYIDFKMAQSLFDTLNQDSVKRDILDVLNGLAIAYDAAIEKAEIKNPEN